MRDEHDPGPEVPEPSEHSRRYDPGLDLILEDVEQVVDPVTEGVSMAPAVGIAVASGPMIALPDDVSGQVRPAPPGAEDVEGTGASRGGDSVRSNLLQAGPVAVAGMVVNGAAALVVVVVARLVNTVSYGEIAQLLGLYFILSMPGSAVLVGVVRRATALDLAGHTDRIVPWARRVHRIVLVGLAVEVAVVVVLRNWIAGQLSLAGGGSGASVVLILTAAGIWILLSVDRGLLQARRRYRSLAGNLLVEGCVRTALVVGLVAVGLGVTGYALGVFASEVVASVHARWLARRAWAQPGEAATDGPPARPVIDARADSEQARRKLMADVSAAFVGLALLGLLQNVDVILLGRLDHSNVGTYAAISVASKALVFGALALGSYLLPEATIRWNEGGHAIRQLGVTAIFLAVPATVLLVISLAVPKPFLTLIFSRRLSGGAPAFATLVVAMMFLSFSVLVTNYLFGTGSRWIVWLLAGGSALALGLVRLADGKIVATARADLIAQGALAIAMGIAFAVIHHRHRGRRWLPSLPAHGTRRWPSRHGGPAA
ncbi:MAG: oligosaccharide flippase family protein [Acidimicrobiales bacterium]